MSAFCERAINLLAGNRKRESTNGKIPNVARLGRLFMTILAKVLLALAIVSSTLAIPGRVIVIDAPQSQPSLVVKKDLAVPPILVEIGRCESGNRQFDKNGEALRGAINSHDVGKFQISETYWLDQSQKLGNDYDIYTEEGNTRMAIWIWKRYGLRPWVHSSKCWGSGLDAVGESSIMKRSIATSSKM